jgi:hypothetical protein
MDILDLYWENMVLGLIGETIDDGDEICGCRVVDKGKAKQGGKTLFKLELWMRTNSTELADRMKVKLIDCLVDRDSPGHNVRSKNLPEFEFKKH